MTASWLKGLVPWLGLPQLQKAPIFLGYPRDPPRAESFYDCIFAKEGDIFKEFMFDWAPVKKLILKEIYEGVKKL